MSDDIVDRVPCPACGAEVGKPCRTMVEGIDMGWTHDARAYADMFDWFRDQVEKRGGRA